MLNITRKKRRKKEKGIPTFEIEFSKCCLFDQGCRHYRNIYLYRPSNSIFLYCKFNDHIKVNKRIS